MTNEAYESQAAINRALCKLIGVDATTARKVTIVLEAGEFPTVTVESHMRITSLDADAVSTIDRYELRRIET